MMDNLNSGIFLIVESTRKGVTEHQHINALRLKVLLIVQLKVSRWFRGLVTSANKQRCQCKKGKSCFHIIWLISD